MESQTLLAGGKRQIRTVLLVFGLLVGLLAAGYYWFLRTDYVALYSGLRAADASAIVARLDEQGISYRLRDGGGTILVPVDEADAVRLAIAGAELPLRGMVGFELFNESDMGLTDFAQRVNYQRALQGELARTIMMMGGIESARVHLALPERSLFRGNRSEPKAAVTVTPRRGGMVDEARVAGIQRLVAAAVPDLALGDVVVLDQVGRLISPAAPPDALLPPEMEERTAVQQYFRARARSAVEGALPGLRFDVRVLALSAAAPDGAIAATAEPAPDAAGPRNFRLRIVILTETAVNAQDQAAAREAVADAVELNEPAGDSLVFALAPVGVPYPAPAADQAGAGETGYEPPALPRQRDWSLGWWLFAMLLGGAALFAGLRLRRPALSGEERDHYVQRIRRELRLAEEGGDGRA